MSDAGSNYTDKKISKLEKRITEVYEEAKDEVEAKISEFNAKYQVKYSIHLQELKDGKITQAQFDSWVKGQVFQGEQWTAKRDSIIGTIEHSNQLATAMVNGYASNVFATNANYMSYLMENGAGVNFGFGLYDSATVVNLIKNDPQILPEWKIDEPKDYIWNYKKVNNAITQGIIQGESLDQIADRLTVSLCAQNKNSMLTHARTAMTGAQNAGRNQSLLDARSKGINVVKEWLATLDGRTRDSHRQMDGETVKVIDKFHPTKFSNGCRFPGDPQGPPHEVYNCRCTMVGDVTDYPSVYQRYDNIDGKPIADMTYKEWYKAKYNQEIKPIDFTPKPKEIDFSKYGGKEVYDILKGYDSWEDFIDNATTEEFDKVWAATGHGINNAEAWFNEIKANEPKQPKIKKPSEVKKLTEEEKALKAYEDAKKKYEDLEQQIKDLGADKAFTGIWKDKVTYADWEAKKDTIEAKRKYFEDQIAKYKKDFYGEIVPDDEAGEELYNLLYKHIGETHDQIWQDPELRKLFEDFDLDEDDLDDVWAMFEGARNKILTPSEYLDQLAEFELHGEEYSKLLAEKNEANILMNDLKPKPVPGQAFSPDAYSEERKNNALWAQSPEEADNLLRARAGEVWRNATAAEKDGIYEYTSSYSKYNEPLRGWEYGETNYKTGTGFKGVGNTDLNAGYTNNGPRLNATTDIIEKSWYDEDIWLQRGCRWDGMDSFFNCDIDLLKHGTQEELENALLGTTPIERGFMSAGSSKGRGLNTNGGILLNIYAPAGTKMMYVEPFSAFGNGYEKDWDGIKPQNSFGRELETLLQQNTQFRVTKIERGSNGVLYFDLEVIDQLEPQRWKP